MKKNNFKAGVSYLLLAASPLILTGCDALFGDSSPTPPSDYTYSRPVPNVHTYGHHHTGNQSNHNGNQPVQTGNHPTHHYGKARSNGNSSGNANANAVSGGATSVVTPQPTKATNAPLDSPSAPSMAPSAGQ